MATPNESFDPSVLEQSADYVLKGKSGFRALPFGFNLDFWNVRGETKMIDLAEATMHWHSFNAPETIKLIIQRDLKSKDLHTSTLLFDVALALKAQKQFSFHPLDAYNNTGDFFRTPATGLIGLGYALRIGLFNGLATLTEYRAMGNEVVARQYAIIKHLREKYSDLCSEIVNVYFEELINVLTREEINAIMMQIDLEEDKLKIMGGPDEELRRSRMGLVKILGENLQSCSKKRESLTKLLTEIGDAFKAEDVKTLCVQLKDETKPLDLDVWKLISNKTKVFVHVIMRSKDEQEFEQAIKEITEFALANSSTLNRLNKEIAAMEIRIGSFSNPLRCLKSDISFGNESRGGENNWFAGAWTAEADINKFAQLFFTSSSEKELKYSKGAAVEEKNFAERTIKLEVRKIAELIMQAAFSVCLTEFALQDVQVELGNTQEKFTNGVGSYSKMIEATTTKYKVQRDLEKARRDFVLALIKMDSLLEGETQITRLFSEHYLVEGALPKAE